MDLIWTANYSINYTTAGIPSLERQDAPGTPKILMRKGRFPGLCFLAIHSGKSLVASMNQFPAFKSNAAAPLSFDQAAYPALLPLNGLQLKNKLCQGKIILLVSRCDLVVL